MIKTAFNQLLADAPIQANDLILQQITELSKYVPKVAIGGVSSSNDIALCKKLFMSQATATGAHEETEPKVTIYPSGIKEYHLNPKIQLYTLPSRSHFIQEINYLRTYDQFCHYGVNNQVPVDLVLWLMDAQDDIRVDFRALKMMKQSDIPIVIVVNYPDIEGEWDQDQNQPTAALQQKMVMQSEVIAQMVDVPNIATTPIVPIVLGQGYHLTQLVETMVGLFSPEKKVALLNHVYRQYLSDDIITQSLASLSVEESKSSTVLQYIMAVIGVVAVGSIVKKYWGAKSDE